MYKVNIICIGTIKESYIKEGIKEYSKRLLPFCKFTIKEIDECRINDLSINSIKKCLKEEAKAILPLMENSINIALEIEGEMLDSVELSEKLVSFCDRGNVNFIIGSSYGLDEEIKRKSDCHLSFGRLTMPHQLMRLILCEQIYRAFMIKSNKSYHK